MSARVDECAAQGAARTEIEQLARRLEHAESSLDLLAERVETLGPGARVPLAPGAAARETESAPATGMEPAASAPPADASLPTPGEQEEFAALLNELLGPDLDLHGSPEDLERFWQLARRSGVADARGEELEAAVAERPDDLDLRMELARAYVAKLFTVPGGPEQGMWGERAEREWQTVIDRDPGHWEAQFLLANNWGYYPDFMGKTGDAIDGLERARAIQEELPPAPDHVQTYLSLSRLYQRRGDAERVRAVLEAGLAFFPGDERLLAALDELER
jgi:tetratricopeptide (TPR) repeat protein